jgi:hypothetical protein
MPVDRPPVGCQIEEIPQGLERADVPRLLAIEPQALRELIAARRRNDWTAVAGIVDWLEAGM